MRTSREILKNPYEFEFSPSYLRELGLKLVILNLAKELANEYAKESSPKYNPNSLLSIKEAAEVLNLTEKQVKSLLDEGKIEFIKIGNRRKIPYKKIEDFIERYSETSNNEITDVDLLAFDEGKRNVSVDTEETSKAIDEIFNN